MDDSPQLARGMQKRTAERCPNISAKFALALPEALLFCRRACTHLRFPTRSCELQGKSFISEEDSPLEGASPAEIEAMAEVARRNMPARQFSFSGQWAKGALEEDPYEVSCVVH